jgi:hypothetical protein
MIYCRHLTAFSMCFGKRKLSSSKTNAYLPCKKSFGRTLGLYYRSHPTVARYENNKFYGHISFRPQIVQSHLGNR